MYKIPYFTEPDTEKVLAFMKQHPFAVLTGNDGIKTVATQVPLLFIEAEGELKLRGHIMRKTDHHLAFEKNNGVLLLFTGPQCYVSSSWYTEKAGATWNYQTVHVRGNLEFLDDTETMSILTALTKQFETGQKAPLFAEDLPDGYMETLVKAIVGFEITISDIYPIFKLSQNRDDESYINIVKHLQAGNDADANKIAQEMINRRPALFTN